MFLLNEAGNSAMEIKTMRTLALEIFKTLNNLKSVTDSNEIRTTTTYFVNEHSTI